jgi:hypothetical protein
MYNIFSANHFCCNLHCNSDIATLSQGIVSTSTLSLHKITMKNEENGMKNVGEEVVGHAQNISATAF